MKQPPTNSTPAGAFGEQLSFLPPPLFCPTWPTRNTLADKALRLLLDGKQFDHPTFEQLTGSWRLSQPIAELRDRGWPVETIDVPSPTELKPDRVIGLYRLDGKFIGLALALAAKEGGKHGA